MVYAAVYVYGGVVQHVEIGKDLEDIKNGVIMSVNQFDPSEDSVQIWDDESNVVFSYAEDILGITE